MKLHRLAAGLAGSLIIWLASGTGALMADDVLVTTSRIPVPAEIAGSSVTVITREDLERRQATSAADFLRGIPGTSISRSGGISSQSQFRMRGAEANQVMFLIDGVEANDPAGNGEFALEHLTAFDVERIEIVRGPQSALWGSDALAGVVNIITRRADRDLIVEGFGEAGSFGTLYGGGRLGGRTGKTQVNLSVSRLDSRGSNPARTGSENDGYDNTTATLSLDYRPRDNLDLSLFGRHSDATAEFDNQSFVTGLAEDTDSVSDIELDYLRAGAVLRLLDNRWTNALRATLTSTDTKNFADGLPDGAVSADKLGIYYQSSFRLDRDPQVNRAGTVTLAFDHEHEDFTQAGTASPFGDPNQDQSMRTTGYALEYLVQPVELLSLSLGARRDHNSDFRDVTTWRSTAAWRFPQAGTRLRGAAGTGQKSPTFIERFGYFTDQFIGNPALKPERSRSWEIGADQKLGKGAASLGVTYFRADLRDEIDGFSFDSDTGNYTATNLAGRSKRRGVEAVLHLEPLTGLVLEGTYTYVDSRQPDSVTAADTREIRRPRNAASLDASYTFSGGRGNTSLNLAYQGGRTDTNFATFPAETVNLEGYTLGTLTTSWRFSDLLTVYGRIENLLNEDYEEVFGYNTPRRGVYGGVRVSFR